MIKPLPYSHKNNKAFTIVELLIVIVVIAILAAVSIVGYTGSQKRAAESLIKNDVANIAKQLAVDRTFLQHYPESLEEADDGKGIGVSGGNSYVYTTSSDGSSYCLTIYSDHYKATSYYISDTLSEPTEGSCEGHEVPITNPTVAGQNWTQHTLPESLTWRGLAYGNGRFVATVAGQTSTSVAVSIDGQNWTKYTMPVAGKWGAIAYGNGIFVVGATDASSGVYKFMTSPDGQNWTPINVPAGSINAIAYGGGRFVATMNVSRSILTSTNGTDWTTYDTAATAGPGGYAAWAITYGKGKFVIPLANTNAVITSIDGQNWTKHSISESNTTWMSAAYGNGVFVAVSSGTNDTKRIITSTDGENWTAHVAPEQNRWRSVSYGKGRFVAISDNGTHRVMTSTDGQSWTLQTTPVQDWFMSSAYGAGCFVAIAGNYASNNAIRSCE